MAGVRAPLGPPGPGWATSSALSRAHRHPRGRRAGRAARLAGPRHSLASLPSPDRPCTSERALTGQEALAQEKRANYKRLGACPEHKAGIMALAVNGAEAAEKARLSPRLIPLIPSKSSLVPATQEHRPRRGPGLSSPYLRRREPEPGPGPSAPTPRCPPGLRPGPVSPF